MQSVDIAQARLDGVCLDARSPAEYAKAHIPGAVNLPLLNDQERAQVGTCYKRRGRNPAVVLGLRLVGARLADLAEQAMALCKPSQPTLVYCWRGGERSASLCWLLEKVGLPVEQLTGGYKAYRSYARAILEAPRRVYVLSGFTGSGKTEILHRLRQRGQQVIDLEGLARHKGSAFGHLDQPPQPSSEMFENLLAQQWLGLDPERPVWIEDESRQVGSCYLPDALWAQLRSAPVFFLKIPQAARIAYLIRDYAQTDSSLLQPCLDKIQRRLGGLNHRQASEALQDQNWPRLVTILLDYYDRAYSYGKSRRAPDRLYEVPQSCVQPDQAVERLLEISGA